MDYTAYETKLKSIVSQPENAPVAVQEILADLKNDAEIFGALTADNTAKDEKIRALQDTNTKLFLQVTGDDAGDNDKSDDWTELEGEAALEAFIEAHKEDK